MSWITTLEENTDFCMYYRVGSAFRGSMEAESVIARVLGTPLSAHLCSAGECSEENMGTQTHYCQMN